MRPEFGRTQYLDVSCEPPLLQRISGERLIVLLGRGCFDLKTSEKCPCDMIVQERLTLKATGDLFGFLSFKSWETSTVKGPGLGDWSAGRRHGGRAREAPRRGWATYGGSQAPGDRFQQTWWFRWVQKRMGESADAVAWPFNNRSGSGLWMGRLINGRRVGDEVDTAERAVDPTRVNNDSRGSEGVFEVRCAIVTMRELAAQCRMD